MPRRSQQVTVATSIALEVRALFGQLLASERQALERAYDLGRLLQPLSVAERNALCRGADFDEPSPRAAREYIRIAENWEMLLAQRCQSINDTRKIFSKKEPEPVDYRDVPLPFDGRCVNDEHTDLPIGECAITPFSDRQK
jgi:hypothetical protein